jgi:hypothetical protein
MRRAAVLFAILCLTFLSGLAAAQHRQRGGFPSSASRGAGAGGDDDVLLATASEWGGAGGLYTCEQWRQYLERMFRLADKRRRGFIDAQDFAVIPRVSQVFRSASFDYFDMAGKGRVSRQEFLAFPNPFFARYDKRKTCRVTPDDIRRAQAPAGGGKESPPSSQGGGFPGMGMGRGSGGGFGGGYGGLGGGGGFGR